MTYKIVLLSDGAPDKALVSYLNKTLDAISDNFGASFALAACPVGASAVQAFGILLPEQTMSEIKSTNAVFLGAIAPGYGESVCANLSKELNLHTRICHINRLSSFAQKSNEHFDFYIVSDAFGGIYDGDKGFRTNNKFGREAYDTECYSELEIERVARIAYELADFDGASDPLGCYGELSARRKLSLTDKADKLDSSKLWRKIVTDVNEDYPQIHVDTLDLNEGIARILNQDYNCFPQDVILAPHLFADVLECVSQSRFNLDPTAIPTAYLGDTALGVYGNVANYAVNPIGILQAVAMMLRHSFNMGATADFILQRLSSLEVTKYENLQKLIDDVCRFDG